MARRMTLVTALFALSAACQPDSNDASAEDTAKAKKSCAKYPDYVPADSPAVFAKLDEHCTANKGSCTWRKRIADVCVFHGEKTSQRYDVMTTLNPRDQRSLDSLCDAMRDGGVVALATRVDLFCRGGKNCMKCGGPGPGR
jgi:hypothetical protein